MVRCPAARDHGAVPPGALRLTKLDVEQVHVDLQAVARLTLTAGQIPTLAFVEYEDELGHGVQAFVQLKQDTFRLWNSGSDPAGRSVIVLATAGEPLPQVVALRRALDLPGHVVAQLWNGERWLTGEA